MMENFEYLMEAAAILEDTAELLLTPPPEDLSAVAMAAREAKAALLNKSHELRVLAWEASSTPAGVN